MTKVTISIQREDWEYLHKQKIHPNQGLGEIVHALVEQHKILFPDSETQTPPTTPIQEPEKELLGFSQSTSITTTTQ